MVDRDAAQPPPLDGDVAARLLGDNFHRDGIPWFNAPRPRRFHRCTPWTSGWAGFDRVDRCACGGIRRRGHWWFERNSRTKAAD